MPKWHIDLGRKVTGGVVRRHRKKKKYEMGGDQILVKVSEKEKRWVKRTKGGGRKIKAVEVVFANVFDAKKNKAVKAKILSVIQNPANPHYVRRNIVTKGAIIKTEVGVARVTSRPSQDGVVNAVLLENN